MKRQELINHLKRMGYLKSERVIEAFEKVDRADFLSLDKKHLVYEDVPIPINQGQTTSAPHIIAYMIELLNINKKQKVLEVGTGTGYQAALLSLLARKVITIERIKSLYEISLKNLSKYKNVKVIHGDGSKGYEKEAPYDRIIVSCAAREIPEKLLEQLKDNGMMIIPIGEDYEVGYWQNLWLIRKMKGRVEKKYCGEVSFVPLISEDNQD